MKLNKTENMSIFLINNKVITLWLTGIIMIPLAFIPSQVMNYLTSLFISDDNVNFHSVLFAALLYFFCVMGNTILDFFFRKLQSFVVELEAENLFLKSFSRVLRTSNEYLGSADSTKVVNRLTQETRNVAKFKVGASANIPITLIGTIFFAYVLFAGLPEMDYPFLGTHQQKGNWLLALLIFILAPCQAIFIFFDKNIQQTQRENARTTDSLNTISHDFISKLSEIRRLYIFNYCLEMVGRCYRRYKASMFKMAILRQLFMGITPMFNAFSFCILLIVASMLCVRSIEVFGIVIPKIGWNDFMGFSAMSIVFFAYFRKIVDVILEWRINRTQIERVHNFLSLPDQYSVTKATPITENQKIIMKEIRFGFTPRNLILKDIDLVISPGEKVAFVGPSGCGKSTTMNLITREIGVISGSIKYGNTKLVDCDYSSLSKEIGMVQQKATIFNLSLRENLLLGLRGTSDTLQNNDKTTTFSDGLNLPELDDKLAEITCKVGLHQDVIRKALHAPIPEKFKVKFSKGKFNSIKNTLNKKLCNLDHLVEQFDRRKIFKSGRLLENLIFGELDESRIPLRNSLLIKWMFSEWKQRNFFSQLIAIGFKQFSEDQKIANEIKHRTPELYEILQSLKQGVDELPLCSMQNLEELPSQSHHLLLSIVLTLPIRDILLLIEEPETLEKAVLDFRKKFMCKFAEIEMMPFDSEDALYKLPLREILLSGQIINSTYGAESDVMEILIQTIREKDFEKDFILMGLEGSAGGDGSNLSGGQAMKLAIARILIKKPNVLLLDEATAALDEKSQSAIVKMIDREFADKTVITISHRLSTIKHYDRIVVFDQGEIKQIGSYEELSKKVGLFQDLINQEDAETAKNSSEKTKNTPINAKHPFAGIPMFSTMEGYVLSMLEKVSIGVECPRDKVLFNQGDEGDEFFIILSGEVDFFTNNGTEKKIIDTLGPGESFGELALFGAGKRTLGAQAKTDLALSILKKEDLLKLIKIHPDIAVSLLTIVSQRLVQERKKGTELA